MTMQPTFQVQNLLNYFSVTFSTFPIWPEQALEFVTIDKVKEEKFLTLADELHRHFFFILISMEIFSDNGRLGACPKNFGVLKYHYFSSSSFPSVESREASYFSLGQSSMEKTDSVPTFSRLVGYLSFTANQRLLVI